MCGWVQDTGDRANGGRCSFCWFLKHFTTETGQMRHQGQKPFLHPSHYPLDELSLGNSAIHRFTPVFEPLHTCKSSFCSFPSSLWSVLSKRHESQQHHHLPPCGLHAPRHPWVGGLPHLVVCTPESHVCHCSLWEQHPDTVIITEWNLHEPM